MVTHALVRAITARAERAGDARALRVLSRARACARECVERAAAAPAADGGPAAECLLDGAALLLWRLARALAGRSAVLAAGAAAFGEACAVLYDAARAGGDAQLSALRAMCRLMATAADGTAPAATSLASLFASRALAGACVPGADDQFRAKCLRCVLRALECPGGALPPDFVPAAMCALAARESSPLLASFPARPHRQEDVAAFVVGGRAGGGGGGTLFSRAAALAASLLRRWLEVVGSADSCCTASAGAGARGAGALLEVAADPVWRAVVQGSGGGREPLRAALAALASHDPTLVAVLLEVRTRAGTHSAYEGTCRYAFRV